MKDQKKKNWFSRHKILTIVIAAALVLLIAGGRNNRTDSAYAQAQVTRRDITTYNSFTGNIVPDTTRSIYPKVSAVVSDVLVSKGDYVNEGDVIATLDSSSAQDQIDLQKSQLESAQRSGDLAVQSAQNSLDAYSSDLQNGLNASISGADQAVNSASSAMNQAKDALDAAQKQKSDAQKSASDAFSNAQTALNNAQNSLNTFTASPDYQNYAQNLAALQASAAAAQTALDQAAAAWNAAKADGNAAGVSADLEEDAAYSKAKSDLAIANQAVTDFTTSNAATTLLSQYNQLTSAVSAAQSAYDAAQNAKSTADQMDLSQLQNAYDNAKSAYDQAVQSASVARRSADEQLDSLSNSVAQAQISSDTSTQQLQIEQAEDSLDDYVITAPISGTVTELNLNKGETAGGTGLTSSSAAAVISDLSRMKIAVKIDEYSIANVSVGSPVTVYIDSISSSYQGTITSVDDTATTSNGISYFNAEVEFTGDDKVHAGVSAEVRLTSADEKNVLSLPSEAISYRSDNTAYVLVKTASGSEERDVTIGASDGTYTEIKDGLNENDTVLYTASMQYPLAQAMNDEDDK